MISAAEWELQQTALLIIRRWIRSLKDSRQACRGGCLIESSYILFDVTKPGKAALDVICADQACLIGDDGDLLVLGEVDRRDRLTVLADELW